MSVKTWCGFAARNAVVGIALSVGLSLSSGVRAQGIPVLDAASIAQGVETLAAWYKQYQQMEQAYNMMQTQLAAVQGPRGMGALLNNNAVRQALPADYSKQYELISKVGSSGASDGAKAIYASVQKYDCGLQFPDNEGSRLTCEAQAMMTAENAAFISRAIDSSQARVADLQLLVNQIDSAADVKAAADLQNRIAVEATILQNEKVMLDMALASQQAQKELVALQRREEGKKAVMENTVNPFSQ